MIPPLIFFSVTLKIRRYPQVLLHFLLSYKIITKPLICNSLLASAAISSSSSPPCLPSYPSCKHKHKHKRERELETKQKTRGGDDSDVTFSNRFLLLLLPDLFIYLSFFSFSLLNNILRLLPRPFLPLSALRRPLPDAATTAATPEPGAADPSPRPARRRRSTGAAADGRSSAGIRPATRVSTRFVSPVSRSYKGWGGAPARSRNSDWVSCPCSRPPAASILGFLEARLSA